MSSSFKQDGFTLLEMLIAVAVTALLITTAVRVFLGINDAQERITARFGRDRAAEVFLDRFERELGGAILIVLPEDGERLDHPYLFVGSDAFGDTGESDGLRFVSRTPIRAAGASEPERLRLVGYGLVSNPVLGLDLMRREDALPPSLSLELPIWDGQVVLEDVLSFGLRYRDDGGGEWRDTWDSTDVALLDQLPLEVEATLQLEESDESGEPIPGRDHSRVIRLPVRPIDMADLRRRAKGGDGCVTVNQCLGIVAEEDEIDPDEIAELYDGAALDLDACWSADLPIAVDLQKLGADTGRCEE